MLNDMRRMLQKTASKRITKKQQKAIGDFIDKKVTVKISKVSKT